MISFLHHQFEQQAAKSPQAVAAVFEDESCTYGELDRLADRLALRLLRHGVQPDDRIALCMERGLEWVVAILAVFKAGAAYVPLDLDYPAERLAHMLSDAAPGMLLTQPSVRERLPENLPPLELVDLTELSIAGIDAADRAALDAAASRLAPRHLACVIYTSGSTGRPKGVMLHHAGLANLLGVQAGLFQLDAASRVLQFSSPSFDASLLDLSMALCHGGRLCLAPRIAMLPGDPLVQTLLRYGITHVTVPPSALAVMAPEVTFPTVRTLVVAGEVCPPAVTRRWAPQHRLVNIYGPTETSVFVTAEVCAAQYPGSTPIGRPVGNACLHILDEALQPVAADAPGQLYVGGVCVSRGYLGQPALTAERFIADPFSADPRARLYKTGDLGRWLPDGSIEYIGRSDHQVKLRGFRIELGEIESRLADCPGVREAVVLCREDTPGNKRLVAYLTRNGEDEHATIASLRRRLASVLPEYMLPSAWVWLERFAVSPNGKTDRGALPMPQADAFETALYEAPRGDLERTLAGLWREVLGAGAVGRQDHFFALGGHSLHATQLAARVRARLNAELPLRQVFEQPRLDAMAAWLAGRQTQERAAAALHAPTRAPTVPRDGPLRTTYSQRRMWLVQQLTPQTTAYNIPFAFRLRGALDVPGLARALDLVAQRHEAFRTRFELVDTELMQWITAHRAVPLQQLVVHAAEPEARLADARRAAADFTVQPFDLSLPALHRTLLVRLADDDHVLLWVIHHAVCDLWSGGILMKDLARCYAADVEGRAHGLEPHPLDYADFAEWQLGQMQGPVHARQLDYWKTRLAGLVPLSLPTDLARAGPLSGRGGSVQAPLSAPTLAALKQLSRDRQSTPFMTLLACFLLLLARRSGQLDFAVGVPIANRQHLEAESLVGTLVNTLVMRNDLSGNPRFAELLQRVHETALQAYAHQDTPFEQLVERGTTPRDKQHSPLVQVLFNVLNAPFDVQGFPRLAVDDFPFDSRASQFDLALSVDTDVFSQVQLHYSSDLFVAATARHILAGFVNLLEQVLADPQRGIDDYRVIGAEEEARLRLWNATSVPLPAVERVDQLVALGAACWASQPALDDGLRTHTHGELEARSNRLARELRCRGVQRGDLVGLCVHRSASMVVAQLAILKAGGAYVPLDPGYPGERLSQMAEDAGLRLLVTESGAATALRWPHDKSLLLDSETDAACVERHPGDALAADPLRDAGAGDPAYVIYTSGSSGKPKGVVVPHRAVVNVLCSMARTPGLAAGDRLLAVTTLSFDIAVLELLLPLALGAQIVLASQEEARDAHALRARLESSCADVMQATPATWQMLLYAGWQGRPGFRAWVGGEALTPQLAHDLNQRCASLHNLYGPTETTVWSTCWRVPREPGPIRIGTPIANTRVHVLDAALNPCPVGVVGEICIAGDGVATGYLDRTALTAEKFVADPADGRATSRLYRTGDRGRWCHDGQLEHLGRADFQIKLRGHRIELGEIEAQLRTHPSVARCVVLAREDTPGDLRLVAYVVPGPAAPGSAELREHLRRRLPEHMLPQYHVMLATLPVLPNGKLDRAALPRPASAPVMHDKAFWVPRTETEVAIAQVWQRLLGVDRVSLTDNFFDLGGHSLLAVRAALDIQRTVGLHLSLRRMVFESLEQLATGPMPATPAAESGARRTPKNSTTRYIVSGLQRMLLNKPARAKE